MVLLHLLSEMAPARRWRIVVAHFNHRFRGEASDQDELLVRHTAHDLGWDCRVGTGSVKNFPSMSREMSARKLRHEFLARTAKEQGIDAIAFGHHADDQLELFFLRLLRGTGSRGAGGMRAAQPGPAGYGVLVRPLLSERRAAIAVFAAREKIPFRHDASNSDPAYHRNRVRHDLLPRLRHDWGPAIDENILRAMEIFSAEADWVESAASDWLGAGPEKAFSGLPLALQRAVIRLQLDNLGIPATFDLVEKLREKPGQALDTPGGRSIFRTARGRVEPWTPAATGFRKARAVFPLELPKGGCRFGPVEIEWELQTRPGRFQRGPGATSEYFNPRKLGREVILRHWQPGDRFQPLGFGAPARLQDIFTNRKISAATRRELVVAATGEGELFWVEGLAPSERYKVEDERGDWLRWNWVRRSGI